MMNNKTRKCCPNCSQYYYLKRQQSSTLKNNLPLFLACGHSMCENCIRNIVKFREPLECKICHQDMVVEASEMLQLEKDKAKLYQIFPRNMHMIGELTLQQLENAETKSSADDKEFFVDLHSILKEGDTSKVCLECHNPTTKMCQQCATILCDGCFTKSHRNFVVFKNHVFKEIDDIVLPSTCKTHAENPLDYYCNDCKKSICMGCLMVGGDKSCKNHNVISMQDVNASFLDELCTLTPKVDETFRRLTKTAYDVGHLLHNLENETGTASDLSRIIANIEQHFSKLCSIVQKHKTEVIDIVSLKNTEKSSLHNIKDDLTNSIKKAKNVMDSIRMTSNANKIKQMNLAVLLEEAKEITESPWYLSREDTKKDPLKVAVNEDLCGLISDYIHLEGNANSAYKLCATAELGEDVEIPPAPPAPVFAPVLPKDVRQTMGKQKGQKPKEGPSQPTFFKNAPQYRSKSGSVNSLNSASSDSSQRSYLQPNEYARPNVQQVQTFPESQHPKQLQEGNQELIYISHIVNPHNFYVQRACHQPLVKDMLRQFRSAHSLPKPSINHVAEDENTSSDSEPAPAANCGLADATPDAETEAGGGGTVLSGAALIPTMESAPSGADIDDDPYPELDPDLLGALGEETGNVPKFGEKIHRNLAQRWDPILKNGLSKETKDKLLKEYLVPENCTLLQAPKLNREVSAAISEASRHRDKRKETEQQQLGVGISAVNKALTLMLTGEDKVKAIRIISDGCRILTDLHYQETQARRSVINYALAKPFLNIVQDGERDDTLYGTKLGAKIKASKLIEKQGLSIKKFVKQAKTTSVTEQAPSSSLSSARPTGAYQGNWAGPSRFQQNRGGRRGSGRTYAPATSRRAPSPHQTAAGATGPNKPRQSATRY